MEFTIRNKDGMGMFYTEYECCVPVEHVDSMASVGLTFYVDGKKVSAAKVKEMFKDAQSSSSSKCAETSKSKVSSTSEFKESSNPLDLDNLGFPVTSRTILCVTTGKVYRNQTEAAKDLNIDPSSISDAIARNREYKGYVFEKVLST